MLHSRQATEHDCADIIRLRKLMHDSMGTVGRPEPGWEKAASDLLRTQLRSPAPYLMVYVVDGDNGPAACATGMVQNRLPSPRNASGLVGYISNVCTDVAYRRRGYARACMTGLMDWFNRQGITRMDLRASAEAEPLYASLGFERTTDPAMRLNTR